jgi:hypothetical protein
MFASVATAKTLKMPITTITTMVWTLATACEPRTFSAVMTRTISTAKALDQSVSPSVNAALA